MYETDSRQHFQQVFTPEKAAHFCFLDERLKISSYVINLWSVKEQTFEGKFESLNGVIFKHQKYRTQLEYYFTRNNGEKFVNHDESPTAQNIIAQRLKRKGTFCSTNDSVRFIEHVITGLGQNN